MGTAEVEDEDPPPPTNPRLPRNLDPVASATRWDTPESPARSGDTDTTSLGLNNAEIGFNFLRLQSNSDFWLPMSHFL